MEQNSRLKPATKHVIRCAAALACPKMAPTFSIGQTLNNVCTLSTALAHRPLSRRLDGCDRVIQNESRDPFGGNVYYVTMQITFFTRKFRNGERHLHCDIVHITTKWVSSLTLDCNGVFAKKPIAPLRK